MRPHVRAALTAGAAFAALSFANGRWSTPIAAWIGPLLLLRFVRTRRGPGGIAVAYAVLIAASLVGWGTALGPMRGPVVVAGVVAYSLLAFLPYLADRFVARRVPGFASTLAFPLAWVTCDLIFGELVGDAGFLGYTQAGFLPLVQIASVTGVFGVTFFVAWFGSVVAWAWEHGFRPERVKRGGAVFAAALGGALAFGCARTMLPSDARPVRVAALTIDASEAARAGDRVHALAADAGPEELAPARATFARLADRMLDAAAREARAGARVVVFSEVNGHVLADDRDALLERAAAAARGTNIDLILPLAVLRPGQALIENQVVFVRASGDVAATYEKSRLAPGEPSVPGDGQLRVVDAASGRLSAAICADFTNRRLLRQAGRAGVELLFDPAAEWPPIADLMTNTAVFRAVESGVSLVKPTLHGASIAVDARGRVIGVFDGRAADESAWVPTVPVGRAFALYPLIGDAFAYGCAAALAALLLFSLRPVRSQVRPAGSRAYAGE